MSRVSIDTVLDFLVLFACICLSSLVAPSLQTPQFSPSLFESKEKSSSCPPNAIQRAMACTMALRPLGMAGPLFNKNIPLSKAIEDGCVDGDFFDALNCIERVMLDCRHDTSDGAHFLRTTINVDNTRGSIIYFCNNVKTYLSKLKCIQTSLRNISDCGQEAKAKFIAQTKATNNVDVLTRFQCSFYKTAVSCAKDVLEVQCGKPISHLVFTVMAGMEPPICTKSIYSISAGRRQQDQEGDNKDKNNSGPARSGLTICCWCFTVYLLLLGKAGVLWW